MNLRLIYVAVGFVAGFAVAQLLDHLSPKSATVGSGSENTMFEPPRSPRKDVAKPPGRKRASPPIGKDGLFGEHLKEPAADEATIDAFLRRHDYSKESMLAAILLSTNPAHLREAAERYPDDPHVQLLIIGSDAFAADRSEWIARFKSSQPENALASLFLGGDLLAKDAVEAGIAELRLAASQSHHDDFGTEGSLAMESALIELGHSVLEAKLRSLPVHAIRHFKQLQGTLKNLQELAANAASSEETAELATLGAALGNQLSQGEAKRFGINRLVGFSIEKQFLEMLEPDMVSPSFNETPAAMLEEVEKENAQLIEDLKLNDRIAELSEQQVIHLVDRIRTVGQPEAWVWLREQLGETE